MSRLTSLVGKNTLRGSSNRQFTSSSAGRLRYREAIINIIHQRNNAIGANNSNTSRSFSAVPALEQQPPPSMDDYSHIYSSSTAYHPHAPEPNYATLGSTSKLNLFTAINSAMRTAMETDPTAILFGEDVAFGGVFRCSQDLREEFGEGRVFNTPLSENGIAVRDMMNFMMIISCADFCSVCVASSHCYIVMYKKHYHAIYSSCYLVSITK